MRLSPGTTAHATGWHSLSGSAKQGAQQLGLAGGHCCYSKERVSLKMNLTEKAGLRSWGWGTRGEAKRYQVRVKLFKPLNPVLPDASPISGLYSDMSQFPLSWVSFLFNRVLTNMVKTFFYNYNLDFFLLISSIVAYLNTWLWTPFLSIITVCSVVMIMITI